MFFHKFDSKVLVIYYFHLNDKWIKEALFYNEEHCKKKRYFTEPPENVPKISKSVQRGSQSEKRIKKIYETFKGSARVSRGRTFSYETFF